MIWRKVWQWLKGVQELETKARVDYRGQWRGKFAHYAIVRRHCRVAVQHSVVVDRAGLKQSEYVSWLN